MNIREQLSKLAAKFTEKLRKSGQQQEEEEAARTRSEFVHASARDLYPALFHFYKLRLADENGLQHSVDYWEKEVGRFIKRFQSRLRKNNPGVSNYALAYQEIWELVVKDIDPAARRKAFEEYGEYLKGKPVRGEIIEQDLTDFKVIADEAFEEVRG